MKRFIKVSLWIVFLYLTLPMIFDPILYMEYSLFIIRCYGIIVLLWCLDSEYNNYKNIKLIKMLEELKQLIREGK